MRTGVDESLVDPALLSAEREIGPPRISPTLWRLFRWYARRYIARHFHAVRIAPTPPPTLPPDQPALIYLNHPSWWDPMICIALTERLTPGRTNYAPMDAHALSRYGFFRRLGFFGVDGDSYRGAARFLRVSAQVLSRPDRALWLTAQGRFCDPRSRPLELRAGVARVAARMERGVVVPVALEYPFWTERCPEALIRVGEPIEIEAQRGLSDVSWAALLSDRLASSMDCLARDAAQRRAGAFTTLIDGSAGVGAVYDGWRRLRCMLSGEPFRAEHRDPEGR